MATLAIDQGSSATKAVVFGGDGAVVAAASAPVSARVDAEHAVEYDPEAVLESVVAAGTAAVLRSPEPVEAVGVGNHGETVLAWDRRSGRPLSAAISWQDRRARAVTDRLRDREGELRAITGLPLDPYFAAPKMRWLRETGVRDGVVTTLDSWLLARLAGEFVTDAATASRTLLLDVRRGEWSDAAFSLLGLAGEERPRIVDCSGELGVTSAFGPSLPVRAAIVDQQAALYGLGCHAPGEAKCTYGTGAFVVANAGPAAVDGAALPLSIAWRLDGTRTYCLDGPCYTAGAAVEWLVGIGLLQGPADLERLAARRDPPRVLFVPALAGSGPPRWSSRPAGAWLGLSLATSADDLVHAAIWGIAAELAVLAGLAASDLGTPLTRLRADGGLARSDLLLQAQSELLGMAVERAANVDATAAGIGALARRAGGGAEPPVAAAAPAAVFEPRLDAAAVAEWFATWREAVHLTAGLAEAE